MFQSKTAIPLCQTSHCVCHKDRCWAKTLSFCISMPCIDPQIRYVLFILLMIQQFFHPTVNNVYATVNRELVGVNNWLKANRLSLNVSITSYMIISNQKNVIEIRNVIQFLQKSQMPNSLALHLMKTFRLMTI